MRVHPRDTTAVDKMDAVVFKKRSKKGGSATSRKRARADNAPEGEKDVEDTQQTIEELLEDQKLRAQLLRDELKRQTAKKASESSVVAAAPEAQYGLHDPKRDGAAGQKLLHLLDGQFTGQSEVTQRDQYEELANKYIEERLQKRTKTDTQDAASQLTVLTDEDALYAELRQEVAGAKAQSQESADGGVLIWNTGIAEVELPSEYHEKTARETQRALDREIAAASGKSSKVDSSALPANFSTDFNRHRSDYIGQLKALSRDEQRERGFVAAPKKNKPSDDQAVSRFRKMENHRRHN